MRQNGFQLMMFTITSPYALVIRVRHVNDDYKRRLKKNMTGGCKVQEIRNVPRIPMMYVKLKCRK